MGGGVVVSGITVCGLATRYDKLASTYRAAVLLRAMLLWLPALAQVP